MTDIVVVTKNPFEVKTTEIAEIEVAYTMMDGRFTHRPADKDVRGESKDKFLDSYEFTPKTSWMVPHSKEMKALVASLRFASRFCCDRHAGCEMCDEQRMLRARGLIKD